MKARQFVPLFLATLGLVSVTSAQSTELVDFATTSDFLEGQNILGGSLPEVADYPLPVVNNAREQMFDHSRSTMFERSVQGVSAEGRPVYQEASLTYSLTNRIDRSFSFPDPGRRISLWIHVDGAKGVGAGQLPFSGPMAKPNAVVIDLLTSDGQTITSKPHSCTRGWNELKFVLDSTVPAHRVTIPGVPVNRVQHFEPENASGTVTMFRVRILGTADCAESEVIGKVALNMCTIEPVPTKIPVVMFYDDGYSSFVNYAQSLLVENGAKATLGFVGRYYTNLTPMHMTRVQTDEAFNLGFDLVNQTMTNTSLHNATNPRDYRRSSAPLGVYDDIAGALNLMRANNLVRLETSSDQFMIYPGGSSDSQVLAAMNELGIRFGRTALTDADPSGPIDFIGNASAIPAMDMAMLQNGISIFGRLECFEQFQDWIDEGLAEGRPRFIVWHEIASDMSQIESFRVSNKYNTPEFHGNALAYLFDLMRQGRIEFKTLPQWYKDLDSLHKVRGVKY